VEPVVTASRGTVSGVYALPVVGTKRWRAVFDLEAGGAAPVDLRLYLRRGGQALTETWLHQYVPFEFPGLDGSRAPAD
jgi:glucans biosynthesis protein